MLALKTFEQTGIYDPNNPTQVIKEAYVPGGYASFYFNRVPTTSNLSGLGSIQMQPLDCKPYTGGLCYGTIITELGGSLSCCRRRMHTIMSRGTHSGTSFSGLRGLGDFATLSPMVQVGIVAAIGAVAGFFVMSRWGDSIKPTLRKLPVVGSQFAGLGGRRRKRR